jgi:hypothetical protein
LNVPPELIDWLDSGFKILRCLVSITPEVFATRKIFEVACEFVVLVEKGVVVIPTGLGFDSIMVLVATPHVENKVDIFVLGKEFGEFCAYIVIGSANGRFVYDEVDAPDAGGSA